MSTKENIEENLQIAVRVVTKAYSTTEKDELIRSAETLAQQAEQLSAEYAAPLRYHEARLWAAAGHAERAIAILDQIIASRIPLPEVLWLKIQLAGSETTEEGNQLRWICEEQLGTWLPISPWGKLRDARLEEKESARLGLPLVDAPRETIPRLHADKLLRIASLFEQMRMDAEAASAYREAVYGAFAPPGFPELGDETWFSVDTADAWLSTARAEARLGRHKWAIQALLATVAASTSQERRTTQLIKEISAGGSDRREPNAELPILLQVADLYRECNLHPRAIPVLDAAGSIPGADVARLRSDTLEAWRRLIASYARGQQTSFLFGEEVSEFPAEKLSPKRTFYGD